MSDSTTIPADRLSVADDDDARERAPARLENRLRRTIGDVRWVWRDGFSRFARYSAAILACMIGGLMTGALALGAVMGIARSLGAHAPIEFARMTIDLATTGGLLLAIGAVGMLGVGSAALVFLAELRLNRLTRDYERVLIDRVIDVGIKLSAETDDPQRRTALRRIVNRLSRIGARWTAFAYRDLLRCVLYGGMSVIAIAAMVLFEPWLTMILVPIASMYVAPLYLINRGVARCQRRYAEANPPARKRFGRLVGRTVEHREQAGEEDRSNAREALFDAQEMFYQRMLYNQRTALVNAAFLIVCLLVLLGYFAAASSDGPAWPRLVAYLIALRFAWSGLRQLTAMLTKISRYLPEFERCAAFVDAGARAAAVAADCTMAQDVAASEDDEDDFE